jgi:hypothetical protein
MLLYLRSDSANWDGYWFTWEISHYEKTMKCSKIDQKIQFCTRFIEMLRDQTTLTVVIYLRNAAFCCIIMEQNHRSKSLAEYAAMPNTNGLQALTYLRSYHDFPTGVTTFTRTTGVHFLFSRLSNVSLSLASKNRGISEARRHRRLSFSPL